MTGREVSSANGLRDRLAVRSSPHVGYPLSQLGINNDPNVASTCAFPRHSHLIVLTYAQQKDARGRQLRFGFRFR